MFSSSNYWIFSLLISFALFGCSAAKTKYQYTSNFGLIAVGETPQNVGIFISTDCRDVEKSYLDCSAIDSSGRKYIFFDGALSKVILNFSVIDKNITLPAGIVAFEDVNSAKKKIESVYGIKLVRGTDSNGFTVFSSDYVLKSANGVHFAIELLANDNKKLIEMSQTTDY